MIHSDTKNSGDKQILHEIRQGSHVHGHKSDPPTNLHARQTKQLSKTTYYDSLVYSSNVTEPLSTVERGAGGEECELGGVWSGGV